MTFPDPIGHDDEDELRNEFRAVIEADLASKPRPKQTGDIFAEFFTARMNNGDNK